MATSYYFDEETRFDFCSKCHRMLPENEMWYFGDEGHLVAQCDDCRGEEDEGITFQDELDHEYPDAYDTMRFDPMEYER